MQVEQIIEKLQPFLIKNNIEILEIKDKSRFIVKTKYGIHDVYRGHLKDGKIPTIITAIDKNEYIINKIKEIHGNKYDYSKINYIGTKDKLVLKCPIHGEFKITANSLINQKAGCLLCGRDTLQKKKTKSIDDFIELANLKHNFKYNYSKIIYEKRSSIVEIICPIHGSFLQKVKDHLQGKGCMKCSIDAHSEAFKLNPSGWGCTDWVNKGNLSKKFDSFKVYVLECFNDNERFIKIGRTYNKVSERFHCNKLMPYEYKVIKIIEGSGRYIFNEENNIKKRFLGDKYLPKIEFPGMYECFDIKIKNKIINE